MEIIIKSLILFDKILDLELIHVSYVFQAQYGYAVVQLLMTHLDENSKKNAKIKASIVDVLSETVLIAAGGSIGALSYLVFIHQI
jgi:hypothetical protein